MSEVRSRREVADILKESAAYFFFRKRYSIHFEIAVMPWGKRRVDLVANKISGVITIVEVKSSIADFKADNKFAEYLKFCDRFYFMFSESVWVKLQTYEELMTRIPKECGVLVHDNATGYARVARKSKALTLEDPLRLSILARLAWRQGDLNKRVQRARKKLYL